VQQLEKMKEELEAVNDSIQTQLDEEQEKNQVRSTLPCSTALLWDAKRRRIINNVSRRIS